VAAWAEFAGAAPDAAAVGLPLLGGAQIGYLATVSRAGTPRVHPVCPFISNGRLYVASGPASRKRLDLVRDGRYALHMLPGEQDAEFLVRGRASRVTDARARALALGGKGEISISEEEWLFELAIERAQVTVWRDADWRGRQAVRSSWP
jgi:hypothetical protein